MVQAYKLYLQYVITSVTLDFCELGILSREINTHTTTGNSLKADVKKMSLHLRPHLNINQALGSLNVTFLLILHVFIINANASSHVNISSYK